MIQNEEQSEWVTGGTVIVFGYSDYVEQMDTETKDRMLPSISEIRQNAENSEELIISSIEEFENSGYSAIELDYHYKSDNYHSKDIYVTNESKDQNYFSVQVQMAMDVVDEETADKILDSLVIAE